MGRYEVEVTIVSGRDLKNVNWRNGDLRPYVVAWVDPSTKSSSKVAVDGDTDPSWDDEKLTIPLPPEVPLEDATLFLDVVHAGAVDGTKPLVGSARLPLRDVLDEAGVGSKVARTIKLKRPSGRPHGKLELKVAIKEPSRYYDRYAPPPPATNAYGQPTSREYYGGGSGGGGYGYGQSPYATAAPPTGYPYAPQPAAGAYGYGGGIQAPYGGATQAGGYGYGAPTQAPPSGGYAAPPAGAYADTGKKSKFGVGTGLAVGAAAGVLGGLALAEGVDYVEDKIADDVTERVEGNLAADEYYDDDF